MDEKIEACAQCNVVKTGARNETLTVYRCVVRSVIRYVACYVTRHQKSGKFLAIKLRGC